MKAKKIIALVAATTLAMSSMTAFADTIDGGMNYVDTNIYKVQLPTTTGMSFVFDPQGLTSLDGETGTYSSTNAGKIVSTGKMTAKNMSSVAVDLYADFYLTDTHQTAATLAGAITTDEDTGKQEQKEIAMTIIPTVANGTAATGSVTLGGAAITAESKIAVTTSAAQTTITTGTSKLSMGPAVYTFGGNKTSGYTYEMTDDTYTGVDLTIGGAIAKDYDWSDYIGAEAKKLTLNAVFKFYESGSTTDEVVNTEGTTSGSSTPATPATPTMTANSGGGVSYTFPEAPSGSLTTFSINGSAKNGQIGSNVTYSNGTLAISKTLITNVAATGENTVVVTIGGSEYTLKFTK